MPHKQLRLYVCSVQIGQPLSELDLAALESVQAEVVVDIYVLAALPYHVLVRE